MEPRPNPGQIVVLNGAPSSIVEVIQETFEGPWMNLGVDVFARQVTPRRTSQIEDTWLRLVEGLCSLE